MRFAQGVVAFGLFVSTIGVALGNPADCGADPPTDRTISGCTSIIQNPSESAQSRASAYASRAYAYTARGKDYLDRAIADYTDAVRLDPTFARAYNGRGFVHSKKGDHRRAIESYSEAIRLDPKYYYAYNNRCEALVLTGQYDRAINDCSEAIRLHPRADARFFYNRGLAFRNKGQRDRAIDDFRKSLETRDAGNIAHPNAREELRKLGVTP